MTQLANKYRPRRFSEVVGQEGEAAVIKAVIAKGWKPNAILATGPFGTGKTTFARLIARAMLCSNPQYGEEQDSASTEKPFEPCGACDDCKAMDTDSHPNYIEVDAAERYCGPHD